MWLVETPKQGRLVRMGHRGWEDDGRMSPAPTMRGAQVVSGGEAMKETGREQLIVRPHRSRLKHHPIVFAGV
jgi:hypothetical protein